MRETQLVWLLVQEERETKTATSRMSGLTDPFVLKSSDARQTIARLRLTKEASLERR
jgi:hypothetical protein